MNKQLLTGILAGAGITILLFIVFVLPQYTPKQGNLTPTLAPTTTATASPTVSPTPTIDDSAALRAAVLQKSGIPANKFEYSVSSNNGIIAKGSVKNSDDMGGAAFFAGKVNGTWVVSYVGQGVPNCSDLGTIPYPTTWISHCMQNGTTVAR